TEANRFSKGLGTRLTDVLADVAIGEGWPLANLPLGSECPNAITVTALVLFGLRDVLKLILDWTPYEDKLALFENENERLIRMFQEGVIPALETFEQLVWDVADREDEPGPRGSAAKEAIK